MSAISSNNPFYSSRVPGYPRECEYCFPRLEFYDSSEFSRHLRVVHSTREGGSYVCRYGTNNVCQKLPLEGVSDVDYEAHIRRFHTNVEPTEVELPKPEEKAFSLNSFTQNLSAVLSDPGRKRTEIASFFTRHWGESFVPKDNIPSSHAIPPITSQQFAHYIKNTAKVYKVYQKAKKTLLRQQIALEDKADVDDLPSIFVDNSFLLSHGPTFTAIFTNPAPEEQDILSISHSGKTVVPYPKQDDKQKTGSFREYKQLHSVLDQMHDVVDSRLAGKLVSKSSAFWVMVNSYGSLHEDLSGAMNEIRTVRSNLQSVDSLVVEQTKKIIRLYQLREQKQRLLVKLHDISCLRHAQSTVQMMLNQSDYPKAIDCIETSQDVLESELHGVQCFRHLSSQLVELYEVIGKMMHEDFAQVIQKEFGAKTTDDEGLIHYEGELSSVLLGLMQVKKYSFMMVIRTEIAETVKSIMRQVVKQRIIESGLDLTDFDPTLTQLGDPVRRLKFSDWKMTTMMVMQALSSFCERLQALQDLMLELMDKVGPDSSGTDVHRELSPMTSYQTKNSSEAMSSEQEEASNSIVRTGQGVSSSDPSSLFSVEIRSNFHLRRAINLIAEYGHHCAQLRLCRLLQARTKQEISIDTTTPAELKTILDIVKDYLSQCADKGWHRTQNVTSSPLNTCLQKLSIEFIDKFHSQRRTKMGEVLDMELWKAADVPVVFQEIADSCVQNKKLRNVSVNKSCPEAPKQVLLVDGEEFVVVSSSLMFVRILADYGSCLESFPHHVTDILSRVVELLKAFNSRCCQLILGAGALQLVGLRTISVRNLALASRSLQLVMFFTSFISQEVDSHLKDDQKHLMRHFRQVQSDYTDHINEIMSKLASVIDHHTASYLKTWEIKGSVPSIAFQQIAKQMSKFHNGMYGVMPNSQIKQLFQMVHNNFKDNIKMRLAELGITPHDTLTYGYVTQDYGFYVKSVNEMPCCTEMQLESLNEVIYGK